HRLEASRPSLKKVVELKGGGDDLSRRPAAHCGPCPPALRGQTSCQPLPSGRPDVCPPVLPGSDQGNGCCPMNIFVDVPTESADATFEPAVLALLRRARAQELLIDGTGFRARRWSLAELQPDEDDYAWLCDWARQLDATVVRKGLRSSWDHFEAGGLLFSAREAPGWLLLLLASEAVRPHGVAGELPWPAVRPDAQGQRRL